MEEPTHHYSLSINPFFLIIIMKKFSIFFILVILFAACSKNTNPTSVPRESNQIDLRLSPAAFNGMITSDQTSIEKLDGYLFVNEVLVQKYPDLASSIQDLKLPIVYYEGIKGSLYMVANTTGVTSALNDPNTLVIGATQEADFPLYFTDDQMNLQSLPLGHKIDLSSIHPAEPLQIKLQHAHARLDLKIEEEGVEITKIEFRDLPQRGELISNKEQSANYSGPTFNFTQEYPTPVTASQIIGYINEGKGLNIQATVYARFNGIEVRMAVSLPQTIQRNTAYTIKITKIGVTLTAVVTVEDWQDGGETDATPDVNTKVFFDPEASILPEGVHYSSTLDTLYLPANKENNLIIALDSDYEVVAEFSETAPFIKLTPTAEMNRFQLQVNAELIGSFAYYLYIKIRNPFFTDYYGERLVVAVTPNSSAK